MPQHTHRNNTVLWTALIAIAIVASIWRPSAQANQQGVIAWEYAILTFRAQDAVVFTNENAFFMEGPEIRKPERIVGDTNIRLVRPIEVEHLTALGLKGWEVVEPWGGGQSYLLRRRR